MKSTCDAENQVALSLGRVIETFDAEVRSDWPFVNQLLERVAAYRGKLLRPRLLLMAAEATGGIRDEHITLAGVVEMVHMATLVHDDVLDEADVRRRSATVNRLIGNEGAVLLGDYLISHAYHLCSSLGSTHYSRRIAAVTNTVCEGELMQIEARGNFDLSERDYLEIIRRKTAALTGVCCELGAAAAGAEDDIIEHMAAFGASLGLAFQIVDDLLDLTASEAEMGKSVGRDADMGKLTLPLIRFRDTASPEDRQRLIAILSNGGEDKTAAARMLVSSSDAIDYARGVARSYVEESQARLVHLPESAGKDALAATAEFVLDRRH